MEKIGFYGGKIYTGIQGVAGKKTLISRMFFSFRFVDKCIFAFVDVYWRDTFFDILCRSSTAHA